MGLKTGNSLWLINTALFRTGVGTFRGIAGSSSLMIEDHTLVGGNETASPNADSTYSLGDKRWRSGQLFPPTHALFRARDARLARSVGELLSRRKYTPHIEYSKVAARAAAYDGNGLTGGRQSGKASRFRYRLVAADKATTTIRSKKSTPLHRAASANDLGEARALIEKNADVNAPDNKGFTPLHLAVRDADADMVKLLLEHDADPNVKTDFDWENEGSRYMRTDYCWAPLHFAARHGGAKRVELLLQHGADPNAKNNESLTPLDLALARGNDNAARVLAPTSMWALLRCDIGKLRRILPNGGVESLVITEARGKSSTTAYIEYVSSIPKKHRRLGLKRDDIILSTQGHFFSLNPTGDEVEQVKTLLSSRDARKSFSRTTEVHSQLGRLVPAEEPALAEMLDPPYAKRLQHLKSAGDRATDVSAAMAKLDGTVGDAVEAIYTAVVTRSKEEELKQKLLSLIGDDSADDNIRSLALWAVNKLFDINGFPVVDTERLINLAFFGQSKKLLRVANWVLFEWQRRGLISAINIEMLNRARYDKSLTALGDGQEKIILDLAVRGIIIHADDVLEIERLRKVVRRIAERYLNETANHLEGLNLLEEIAQHFPQTREDERTRNFLVRTLQEISGRPHDTLTRAAIASLMRALIFTPANGTK